MEEENNEVNSFFGWAIFSTLKKHADHETEAGSKQRELLSLLMIREREIDEYYLRNYYDTNIGMLNHSGLTLVSGKFFKFGRKLMKVIRNTFNDVIAEETIMEDKDVFLELVRRCKGYAPNVDAVMVVSTYNILISKAIDARMGKVWRCCWKRKHLSKITNVSF